MIKKNLHQHRNIHDLINDLIIAYEYLQINTLVLRTKACTNTDIKNTNETICIVIV